MTDFETPLAENSVEDPSGHWLYRIIPASWAEANVLTAIPWALFGNDEGGIFGERDPYHTVLGEPLDVSFVGFLRWWKRNSFHNLVWHTLKWDAGDNALVLYARDETGSRFWFRAPQKTWYVEEQRPQLYIRLVAPLISWRGQKWEGYLGWRHSGALGVAWRK